MTALNRKLIRDLWHLRGQIFATALVVGCGIASFVAMRSVHESLLATRNAYYSAYRFADVFASLKRAPESLAKRLAEIPGVAAVQTRVVAGITIDVPDLPEPAQGRLISIPEKDTQILNDLDILRGRYIEENKPDEIIISGSFSDANKLNPGDSLSAIINGRWRKLQIVGVALSPEYIYEIRPGDVFPDPRRYGVLWMSRKSVASAFQMDGAFNDVSLTLAPAVNIADVIERLDKSLETYGGFGAFDRNDQYSHRFLDNELGELEVFGTVIPVIFLAVTAFLLNLILSRLVNTEREQIAVLKAFGYSNFDVGFHYLGLTFLSVTGGIIFGILAGIWVGSGMTALYGRFFKFPFLEFVVSTEILLLGILISLGAAIIGAIGAVRKAVLLPPAEAMRPEPPAQFRSGILEKLGMQKFLPTAVRITIRNLARHPIKAGLSAFGISLAVALLFIGFFFFDSVNRIVDIQFNRVIRFDAEVIFNDPRPGKTRFDLEKLPGVLRVETFRVVPARIRFENRSRRIGLTGYERDMQLRQIIDKEQNIVEIPFEGIMLTKTLADSIGAKEGDQITLEITEGSRPITKIRLEKTVDELVGLLGYMEIGALNRLLNEGDTISGAELLVDQLRAEELYRKLKATPEIRGVGLPAAALQSFNETVAQTIGTSTSFLIGFSVIIAFGVVYNGARIALSERGRELASLRVLGFTRNEISAILLGEQGVLTALGIPLGFLIGYSLCVLITKVIDVEIVRLPLALSAGTFIFSFAIIVTASLLSGLLVARRLRTLDLVEVLKTRE